jgi:hypothetical protein
MKHRNLFLSLAALISCTMQLQAQIPETITYQGFLESGGQPIEGSVAITVRLYAQPAGGVADWVGTFPAVSVSRGVYTLSLNVAGIAFTKPYYLETEINGSVSPSRTALTSAPYALGPWASDASGSLAYGGSVAIGFSGLPQARLEVSGDWDAYRPALRLSGNKPSLEFIGDASSGNKQWLVHLGSNGPGNLEFYDMASNIPALSMSPQGNTRPRLQLYAQSGLETVGYQPFLTLTDDNAGYAKVRMQCVGGDLNLQTQSMTTGSGSALYIKDGSGNVGIGTGTPQAKLDVAGRTRTQSLEITGGGDLAEPFASLEPDGTTIEPGTVISIDPEHPGLIRQSTSAYDRGVVGIVSGAGDVRPGLTLRQDTILDGHTLVAISGRVYCKAEAIDTPIVPGDLLTSSSIGGYAMKAVDKDRLPGTIIGKAMTGLDSGKGLVLVLVSLR